MTATLRDRGDRSDYMRLYRSSEIGQMRIARGKAAWRAKLARSRRDDRRELAWLREVMRLDAAIRRRARESR